MLKTSKTIVFIHGAWMTPKCWDKFLPYFRERGYQCIAPSWPFKDRSVQELNDSPNDELGSLSIEDIVHHYSQIISELDESPILIGHSFGGLFVQLLLDQGYGCAGISINSAPPKGVFAFYPKAIKANFWILKNPFKKKRVLQITPEKFYQSFVHTLDPQSQKEIYQNYVVPEGSNIFFEAAFSQFNSSTKVDYKNNERNPLLLIAGSED